MTTHYFINENGRIAYDQNGSGPLVVCVPGMGDVRGEYRYLAPQLVAAGFRVVTVDIRGHGESSTEWQDYSVAGVGGDLLALIRSLKSGPALVVGTSMAAGAAVWAAAEAPELIRGMALFGPFVRGETNWQSRLMYAVLFSRPWGPAMWGMYYNSLYPTRKPADLVEYIAALKNNLGQAGRLEALQKMMALSKRASEERLGRVQAPTLILMGSKDPDFKQPEVDAAWVARQLKGRLEMIEGAGHYPHAEMPEICGPLVVSFFKNL